MPKYRLSDMPLIDNGRAPCCPSQCIPLSEAGSLTQFGAWIVVLPPGSLSSIPHWHSSEDELIQVLEGEAVLLEGGEVHLLGPGAVCAYPAGLALSHSFENRSHAPLRLLGIGTRSGKAVCTYPEADLKLIIDDAAEINEFRNAADQPVPNPYDG
ncbi:cupin domain-containing protein [Rhizobium sp. BR 314]|uniref:cupin domain-containing protein n=1 Tax=Rhizobium sp. BR 314 TaxID=3040013 RepID=UPI0039BF1A6C